MKIEASQPNKISHNMLLFMYVLKHLLSATGVLLHSLSVYSFAQCCLLPAKTRPPCQRQLAVFYVQLCSWEMSKFKRVKTLGMLLAQRYLKAQYFLDQTLST